MRHSTILLLIACTLFLGAQRPATRPAPEPKTAYEKGVKMIADGLPKDALELLKPLTLDRNAAIEPGKIPYAVKQVVTCFQNLNRAGEIDAYLDEVLAAHPADPDVLVALAEIYFPYSPLIYNMPHYGFMIDNKFVRGTNDGSEYADSSARDRVRALQLMRKAEPLYLARGDGKVPARFYLSFASMFVNENGMGGMWGSRTAWMLQPLTDLENLPDYEESNRYGGRNITQSDAPVDADGNPVYYTVPESFATAKNDGERWRWLLDQAANADPEQAGEVLLRRARFNESQFGAGTLAEYRAFFDASEDGDVARERRAGIWALNTLPDGEAIAKLATGVKRFALPEEFHPIALCNKVLDICPAPDVPKVPAGTSVVAPLTPRGEQRCAALEMLAGIMMGRRQYERAAGYLKQLLEEFPHTYKHTRDGWQARLDQIEKNWGSFEPTQSAVAGRGVDLKYRFRNGKSVKLTAHEIKIPVLIADIKAYIRSKPAHIHGRAPQIEQIGYRLVNAELEEKQHNDLVKNYQGQNKQYIDTTPELVYKPLKYLGGEVASWTVPLEPAEKHFDRITTITTPMTAAGAYLVSAEMENGNTVSIVVWQNDVAIVKTPVERGQLYYVADAETGAPLAGANVELFGYAYYHDPQNTQPPRKPELRIREETLKTDRDGLAVQTDTRTGIDTDLYFDTLATVLVPAKDGKKGTVAYLGFDRIWMFPKRGEYQYREQKGFFISDRPVYRPGDTVEMKCWVATAAYDETQLHNWAGTKMTLVLNDPKGEERFKTNVTLGKYGGMVESFTLPADATLGTWSVQMRNEAYAVRTYGNFRVEEYKKPEYEVTVDAPKEPVALGGKFEASIRANYYFGAPVVDATVKYKVLREKHAANWYPVRPWDWFYGNGYGWFAYDYDWYPGWSRWGCRRPPLWWMPVYPGPPEVVAEREVPIGTDGTVKVEIDTAFVKELFPGDDQKYTIQAEVVDQSRRTITGAGSVIVAQKPFRVYASTNRGWYEPEQQIDVALQTRRADGKPVAGEAVVKLLKISYNKNGGRSDDADSPLPSPLSPPVEIAVHTETVKIGEDGAQKLSLRAAEPGQYRVSCTVKDANGNEQEGGSIFCVYGPDRAGVGSFAFDDVEIVPDRAEYAPGEPLKLRINTRRSDATVLLYVKPEQGVYPRPQVLRLDGKSTAVELPVALADMPNFFLEAVVVSGGQVYRETKNIAVPPENRVLNVEVTPSAETYKPGGKASAELRITDLDGKPVVGQTVVSIYDKSVEYISGGSNVPDIKEFFWKWTRNHYPNNTHNLERNMYGIPATGKPEMQQLGPFGGLFAYNQPDFNPRFSRQRGLGLGGFNSPQPSSLDMKVTGGAVFADGEAVLKGGIARRSEVSAPAAGFALGDVALEGAESADAGASGGGMVEPTVRENFADTALWVGALETDANGVARIELDMPESLTTWKINVWSMGAGTRVGYGNAEVITRKDLMIRMQTPRFLVQGDRAVFSANVHNYLKTDKNVEVALSVTYPLTIDDGIDYQPSRNVETGEERMPIIRDNTRKIDIPAGGEARVDWEIEAASPGEATITMKALTDEESDAMRKTLPVHVHGMLKQEAWSGYVKPDQASAKIEIDVPAERRPEETVLTVRFSPTLAGAMIDALPYLVEYPYGCTEQTLNRFLPTVLTQRVLQRMGVDLAELEKVHANLNAQELGDPKERAGQWNLQNKNKRPKTENPVYSVDTVNTMVADGVKRLTAMQCSDGGWGWFSGYGERSGAHLTALVVHGLQLAQANDVALEADVLERGIQWLLRHQAEQVRRLKNGDLSEEERKAKGLTWSDWKTQADEGDAFTYMVLAECGAGSDEKRDMKAYLWRDRAKVSLYAVSMFGIALAHENAAADADKIAMCVRMLEQRLVVDDENQTAYLNLRGDAGWRWWCWYGSEFETQAYFLKLLCRAAPKNATAPKLVKYLLNNRRHATYWNSTRDTAVCVEAFCDFLKASGEDAPDMTVEVLVDGKPEKIVRINKENLFTIDNTLVIGKSDGSEPLADGKHVIELRKTGTGPLYFNAYLQNFTLEPNIEKTGLEVKVERRAYRLDRDESATAQVADGRGQVVEYGVEKYKRTPLGSLAEISTLASGQLVEIELIVESKNDYESIIIEDRKAAGFEPVDLRSGYTGNALGAYVEYRDDRVALFVYRLPRGTHSLTYRVRAEQPGVYAALPAVIEAMYAPELKGNSDEFRIDIRDREE